MFRRIREGLRLCQAVLVGLAQLTIGSDRGRDCLSLATSAVIGEPLLHRGHPRLKTAFDPLARKASQIVENDDASASRRWSVPPTRSC